MQPMTSQQTARITLTATMDLPVDLSDERQADIVSQIRALIDRRILQPERLEYLASRVDAFGRVHLADSLVGLAAAKRSQASRTVLDCQAAEVRRLLPEVVA